MSLERNECDVHGRPYYSVSPQNLSAEHHRGIRDFIFFFLNDPPTPELSPLPLHDPLPIGRGRATTAPANPCTSSKKHRRQATRACARRRLPISICSCPRARPRTGRRSGSTRCGATPTASDRKSTRLNSSHSQISYAVFCLK